MSTIHSHFRDLSDPRIERTKKHSLITILVIALCAVICGAEDWVAIQRFGELKKDWFAGFLDLRHGIPSHDTLSRVFCLLDNHHFSECFINWVESLTTRVKGIIAIDGKRLCAASSAGNPLHVVNAWCVENQLALAQCKVADKSNEMTAIPLLLQLLDIKGATITLDAIGCQKEIATLIRQQQADYVLALKRNQRGLYKEVSVYLNLIENQQLTVPYDYHVVVEKGHGRRETREYWALSELKNIKTAGWTDMASIIMVKAKRAINGKQSTQKRFYISSLPATKLAIIAKAIRAHWQVENNLHWQLDVSFQEDQWRSKAGNAATNMALLNKMALNLLKQEKTGKAGIKNKRLMAGWDNHYLTKVLQGRLI
jgi:predicted transposase YbfD/YdcC